MRFLISKILLSICVLTVVCSENCEHSETTVSVPIDLVRPICKHKLIFNDEFEFFNKSKWNDTSLVIICIIEITFTTLNINFQSIDSSCTDRSIFVEHGMLIFRSKDIYAGVLGNLKFKYGRIEIRAKIPISYIKNGYFGTSFDNSSISILFDINGDSESHLYLKIHNLPRLNENFNLYQIIWAPGLTKKLY